MDEFLKGILTAPVATLLILAGIFFLFIAIVGNVSGKIEPDVKGRIASGVLGLVFVSIGLTMHLTQEAPQTSQEAPRVPTTSSPEEQVAKVPQTPTVRKVEDSNGTIDSAPSNAGSETEAPNGTIDSAPSNADKEPNDFITAANLITEGIAIRGSIATKQDRDFYKFNAPSSKTRVILRKISVPGFGATVQVYDAVENQIKKVTELDDQPVTLAFESNAGSIYYVLVTSYR
ncbi:MAG: hypothetical protein MJA27_23935, partial [Pseudanabaenales cyanobacterium]|nr:hypothetical protein [Pseudanabaenales cyanobacterium]